MKEKKPINKKGRKEKRKVIVAKVILGVVIFTSVVGPIAGAMAGSAERLPANVKVETEVTPDIGVTVDDGKDTACVIRPVFKSTGDDYRNGIIRPNFKGGRSFDKRNGIVRPKIQGDDFHNGIIREKIQKTKPVSMPVFV